MDQLTKTFAPGREREENGWLVYPRDKGLRQTMYPAELIEQIMTHPAKMNAHLCKDIVEYVSEPGETILDCFGGVGTSLVAATLGRNVVLVEIEDYYANIIRQCIEHLEAQHTILGDHGLGLMTLVQSDNRLAMPIPCDHIITSPPYGNDLAKESEDAALNKEVGKQGMQYTKATQNIGKLPPFIYKQAMNKVYELMVKSVKVGGTITITHRDRTKDGERILYIDSIVSTLMKLGCGVKNLDKWKAPGSIAARVNEQLGNEVILDEDIITMVRLK